MLIIKVLFSILLLWVETVVLDQWERKILMADLVFTMMMVITMFIMLLQLDSIVDPMCSGYGGDAEHVKVTQYRPMIVEFQGNHEGGEQFIAADLCVLINRIPPGA